MTVEEFKRGWLEPKLVLDDEHIACQEAGQGFKVRRSQVEVVLVDEIGFGLATLKLIGKGTTLAKVRSTHPWAEAAQAWLEERLMGEPRPATEGRAYEDEVAHAEASVTPSSSTPHLEDELWTPMPDDRQVNQGTDYTGLGDMEAKPPKDNEPSQEIEFTIESQYVPKDRLEEPWSPQFRNLLMTLAGLLVVVIGGVIAWSVLRGFVTQPTGALVPIGEVGVLSFSEFVGEPVDAGPVFATVEGLNRFVQAVAVKDRYGYREALVGAYAVQEGTRVQVIGGAGLGKRQVRVLEGRYAGASGYVLTEWVRR